MNLLGLDHEGHSQTFKGSHTGWSGEYERTTNRFDCECGAQIEVLIVTHVGPPGIDQPPEPTPGYDPSRCPHDYAPCPFCR